MIKRTAYQCEWCKKKILLTKDAMAKHENYCYFNPKEKACVTCQYPFIEEQWDKDNNYIEDIRKCEKGVDLEKKLRNHCKFYKEGEMNKEWETRLDPATQKKRDNCNHNRTEYLGKDATICCCKKCGKIIDEL